MTTARIIIKKAMNKIGALVKNEAPDADEANDALDSLNAMIASWSNDSLNIYARTWETFTLTSGQKVYTIGDGAADFDTVRPMTILESYIKIGVISYTLNIITDEAYNDIDYKDLQNIPDSLNYDNAYPIGNIRIFPVPSSNYPIFLLTEKELTTFDTLDTELSMPRGTERALIYNLAMELAPEYGEQPDASIVRIAGQSLGLIRTTVAKVRTMDAYPINLRVRNIYTGWRY